jgi:hypothetical protein
MSKIFDSGPQSIHVRFAERGSYGEKVCVLVALSSHVIIETV